MKMDKNIFKAIIVSFLIIMAMQYVQMKLYPPPNHPAGAPKLFVNDLSDTSQTEIHIVVKDTSTIVSQDSATAELYLLEDDKNIPNDTFYFKGKLYDVVMTEKGGVPLSIKLNDYKNDSGLPINLVGSMDNHPFLPLSLKTELNRENEVTVGHYDGTMTSQFSFLFQRTTNGKDGLLPAGIHIEKQYTFNPDKYSMKLQIRFLNRSHNSINMNQAKMAHKDEVRWGSLFLNWTPGLGYNPHIRKHDMQYIESFAYMIDDKVKQKGMGSGLGNTKKKKNNEENIYFGKISWIALENQYFTSAILPRVPSLAMRTISHQDGVEEWDMMLGEFKLDPNEVQTFDFDIFVGPKTTKHLEEMGHELIHLDGMSPSILPLSIARGMVKLLSVFYSFTGNYGVAIVLVTILIRILMFPLTQKSLKSMKQMQDIQPKMKALQEKYKKNKEKLNSEVMKLYKEHRVNPMGGCLPMVIQIPIFFALYIALRQAIDLRGATFIFWMRDLSAPDTIFYLPNLPFFGDLPVNILPILMFITMYLQQKMTMTKKPSTEQERVQQQMMKMMNFFFLFIFWNLPSGLVLYWTLSNVFQLLQQFIINRMNLNVTAVQKDISNDNSSIPENKGGKQ